MIRKGCFPQCGYLNIPARLALALVLLIAALGIAPAPMAQAGTITVGGACTLVDAITAANTDTASGGCTAGSGADTINLQSGTTYTLTTVNNPQYGPNGLPSIISNITIQGNGATIARDGAAPNFRFFHVIVTGTLTLRNLTLHNGRAQGGAGGTGGAGGGGGAGMGGAIFNQGALTLESCTLSNNTAIGGNGAAGGYNSGGGGGGGMGGNGGNNSGYGAGGGGGFAGAGGQGNGSAGSNYGGGGGGIQSYLSNSSGGAGNGPGGHGGNATAALNELNGWPGSTGGGGGGAAMYEDDSNVYGGSGGTGGIGGGGGGGSFSTLSRQTVGGAGGWGGGGGGGSSNVYGHGGAGGFGGGGGAAGYQLSYPANPGAGGWGGGQGGRSYALIGGSGAGGGLGGAIFSYTGTITITNSTLSGNTAIGGQGGDGQSDMGEDGKGGDGGYGGYGAGGAIFNYHGKLAATNNTFSGNAATGGNGGAGGCRTGSGGTCGANGNGGNGLGGAIFNRNGAATLTHNTIVSNTVTGGSAGSGGTGGSSGTANGGGAYNHQDGGTATLALIGAILANTPSGRTDCYNNGGTVTAPSANRNLIENNATGGNACGTPYSTSDPNLGSLTNNGGNTWTHALLSGSPAIDAVPVISCTVTTDQRGTSRPQGAACDIGSYELAIEAEVFVVKTVSSSTAYPGQSITYTLRFSNTGSGTAAGIWITDIVPISVTTTSVISSGVAITRAVGTRYIWQVQNLGPMQGGFITVVGVLSSPLASGRFTNTATIATTTASDNPANNSDSAGVTILNAAPVAVDDGYDASAGVPRVIAAPGVLGNDTDLNGDPLTAALVAGPLHGTLAFKLDGSFTYTSTPGFEGTDVFTYTASDGVLTDTGVTTITVVSGTDLAVGKMVNNDMPREGETIVYTVRITNTGLVLATGIVVSDTLPSGVTHIADDGGANYNATTGAWNVGSLGMGASATLHITATVDGGTKGQTITNTAVIAASDQPDPVSSNNRGDVTITVAYCNYLPIVLRQ